MNPFRVELSQQAASYLRRLDQPTKERIVAKLSEIAKDPSAYSKGLVGRGGARAGRVGPYRIVFDINVQRNVVEVSAILPRGDVYKHTKR